VEGFSLSHALVFGALISATDPIAVVGLFKVLGAPRRLVTLVEGESLVNDGTGVVVFTIALAVAAGERVTVLSGLVDFLRIAGLGVLVGLLAGWAVAQVIVRIDEAMLELTLTMIAAYGSFAIAEQLHVSGVMATVSAGMVCGSYAARVGMSPTTRVAVETFWEYVAFALNSMVFLLIGLEVDLSSLLASWQPVLVAFAATMVGRFAVVFGVSALLRRTRSPVSWKEGVVLGWAGLRGALSMVLALSLPESFEYRTLLIHMTFGVVLLSILLQGLSMGTLLRRLGLVGRRSEEQAAWAELRAQTGATRAALQELERLAGSGAMLAVSYEALKAELVGRQRVAEDELANLRRSRDWIDAEELGEWRRRLLHAERQAVLEAQREGSLTDEGSARLLADIDARLTALEHPSESREGNTTHHAA
jgi:monovalent cation:H+ antiporter, CPA1 family